MRIVLRLLTVHADAIEAIVVDSLSSNRYVYLVISVNSLTCQEHLPRTTLNVRIIPFRQYRDGRVKLPLFCRWTDPHLHEKFDPPFLLATRSASHTSQPPPDSLGSFIEMFRRASRPR
jgi:hypothetical protein